MSDESQTTIFGTNLNAVFRNGYQKGKNEQLEQDMAMIQEVLSRSSSFENFRNLLKKEIERIDTRVWL